MEWGMWTSDQHNDLAYNKRHFQNGGTCMEVQGQESILADAIMQGTASVVSDRSFQD